MALSAGNRLGPYEILGAIGAGGMGEVYRARDTRLGRDVAIKVLPSQFAADADLRARFEREARTVSSLEHPHICPLYDIGEHDGIAYLVMPHLEGETLEQRLKKGALPIDQAVQYGIEIADAMDKAHRKGIVHRDLKPGNIMLTKSGATLLDFGLAKAQPVAVAGNLSMLPTTPPNLTAQGTLLGTFQYMAPEQLEGADANPRTDIFSFGAVLYEMLTGRKAFVGKSHASLIAAILDSQPPPVSTVQPLTPRPLDHVVTRCLAKSPDDRWQTASDVRLELKWIAESVAQGPQTAAGQQRAIHGAGWGLRLRAAGAMAVAAAVAGGLAWNLKPSEPRPRVGVARLSIMLPPGEQVASLANPTLALSRDGMQLAFAGVRAGRSLLFLRAMNSTDMRAIQGTEDAANPFFSPDGQWLGFFAQNKLKKVSVASGTVQVLCDAPGSGGKGASWGLDNNIYFAASLVSGISKIAAAGGSVQPVTRLNRDNGEVSHRWPHVLPGGKAVLFTVWTGPGSDERHIHAQNLETGERHALVQGGESGRYVSTGHLVYAREDALLALPMDPDRLQVAEVAPISLAERVRSGSEGAHFDASDSGELVYLQGDPQRYERRLSWVDRTGTAQPLPIPARWFEDPVVSPSGRHAAVTVRGGTAQIWIYDFSRPTLTPLTTTTAGSSQAPIWSPDGTRVVYRGTRKGFRNLFWKTVDGVGDEEQLTTKENTNQTPGSFSPDGKWLVFTDVHETTGMDIWALRLDGERKLQPLLTGPSNEVTPRFSPDGRWLAYVSNESGQPEIYVRAFPSLGDKQLISTEGGDAPVWSRDGRELFYSDGDRLMAVPIGPSPTLSPGSPRVLYEGRYVPSPTTMSGYDVSPDGQRFLRVQPTVPDPPADRIQVVMNWFEDVRRLAPGK